MKNLVDKSKEEEVITSSDHKKKSLQRANKIHEIEINKNKEGKQSWCKNYKSKQEKKRSLKEKSNNTVRKKESDMIPANGAIKSIFNSESFSVPRQTRNLYQNELTKKNNKLLCCAILYLQDQGISFTEIDEVKMEKLNSMKEYVFVISLKLIIMIF